MISLSKKEYEMIDSWRSQYVNDFDKHFIPAQNLLIPWSEAKEQYLYKLFDSQLILTRPNISFPKDINAQIHTFTKNLNCCDFLDDFEHALRNYFRINSPISHWWSWPTGLKEIFRFKNIILNRYDGPSLDLIEYFGTTFKVNHGEKIMKIFRKILDILDIEELNTRFETFRIEVSKITNGNAEKGTLCLSIHPLDYMTMSDNSYDWNTCMSWDDEGAHRLGTTTMMNSPCVVEAYILGQKKFYLNCDGDSWSNKKWRCLFIVTPEVIASIKDYPYNSDKLRIMCVDWLKELAEKNLGWVYDQHMFTRPIENSLICDLDGHPGFLTYNFLTNIMYNDFGANIAHFFYFAPSLLTGYYSQGKDNGIIYRELNYCGYGQCMSCGKLDTDWYKADTLECASCSGDSPFAVCERCGREFWDEDDEDLIYDEHSGNYYCCDCVATCDICQEESIPFDSIQNQPVFLIEDTSIEKINEKQAIINSPKESIKYRLCVCPCCYEELLQNEYRVCSEKDSTGIHIFRDKKYNSIFFLLKENKSFTSQYCGIDVVDSELPKNIQENKPIKVSYTKHPIEAIF